MLLGRTPVGEHAVEFVTPDGEHIGRLLKDLGDLTVRHCRHYTVAGNPLKPCSLYQIVATPSISWEEISRSILL